MEDMQDFFKKEWDYTLQDPAFTSFDQDMIAFKSPVKFSDYI